MVEEERRGKFGRFERIVFISYTKLEKYSARMTGKFGRKGPIRELSRGGFSVEKLFFRRRSVTNHHFEIETGEIVRLFGTYREFEPLRVVGSPLMEGVVSTKGGTGCPSSLLTK